MSFSAITATRQKCCEKPLGLRWPSGFVYPACGGHSYCGLNNRRLYHCDRCQHQCSSTAGTIFCGTLSPLRERILAIYLLTQPTKSPSSLELKRQLVVRDVAAWLRKHKLMQMIFKRQFQKKHCGCTEMGDAVFGSEKPPKRGQESGNKISFLAAMQTQKGQA